MPRLKSNPKPKPATDPSLGTFQSDGSWWAEGRVKTREHDQIIALARRIHREEIVPRRAAQLLREAKLKIASEATLALWEQLEHFNQWPCAHTDSAASEFIKREVIP